MVRPIRGLSVQEALIQMKLSTKQKGSFVANCIRNAAKMGVNNFFMDPTRLVVAEVVVNRASILKRMRTHGRGRMGIIRKPFAHLVIKVKEQKDPIIETRVGRRCPKRITMEATTKRLEALGLADKPAIYYPPSKLRGTW